MLQWERTNSFLSWVMFSSLWLHPSSRESHLTCHSQNSPFVYTFHVCISSNKCQLLTWHLQLQIIKKEKNFSFCSLFFFSSLWQKAVQWRKDLLWLTPQRNEAHRGWEGMAGPVWSMASIIKQRRGNDSCQQAFFPAHFLLTIELSGCILPLQLDLTGNTLIDTIQGVPH